MATWVPSELKLAQLCGLKTLGGGSSFGNLNLSPRKCLDTLELGSPKILHFSSNMPRRGRGVRSASKTSLQSRQHVAPSRVKSRQDAGTSSAVHVGVKCWRIQTRGSNAPCAARIAAPGYSQSSRTFSPEFVESGASCNPRVLADRLWLPKSGIPPLQGILGGFHIIQYLTGGSAERLSHLAGVQ